MAFYASWLVGVKCARSKQATPLVGVDQTAQVNCVFNWANIERRAEIYVTRSRQDADKKGKIIEYDHRRDGKGERASESENQKVFTAALLGLATAATC